MQASQQKDHRVEDMASAGSRLTFASSNTYTRCGALPMLQDGYQ